MIGESQAPGLGLPSSSRVVNVFAVRRDRHRSESALGEVAPFLRPKIKGQQLRGVLSGGYDAVLANTPHPHQPLGYRNDGCLSGAQIGNSQLRRILIAAQLTLNPGVYQQQVAVGGPARGSC